MAYIVGVLFNALVFVGLPLEYLADQSWVAAGWTAHGFIYVLYLLAAFMLTRRLRLNLGQTLVVLLAGTVPVMTFVVERWVTRRFLSPTRPGRAEGASAQPPGSDGTAADDPTGAAHGTARGT